MAVLSLLLSVILTPTTSRRRRGLSRTPSPRPAPTAQIVTPMRSRGPLVDFDFRTAWDARNLGLVVVPVEAREAVAVHLLEGFVVRRHDGLSALWRLRLVRLARGAAVVCALSVRPAASGIGHGSVSCRRRGEIAVCLVLPRVHFRNPLRALRGLAGDAVLLSTSCANQFRRVRPAGPCLRASELHSRTGVWAPHGAVLQQRNEASDPSFYGFYESLTFREFMPCTSCDNRVFPHAVGLLAKMSAPRRPNRPDSRHGADGPNSDGARGARPGALAARPDARRRVCEAIARCIEVIKTTMVCISSRARPGATAQLDRAGRRGTARASTYSPNKKN